MGNSQPKGVGELAPCSLPVDPPLLDTWTVSLVSTWYELVYKHFTVNYMEYVAHAHAVDTRPSLYPSGDVARHWGNASCIGVMAIEPLSKAKFLSQGTMYTHALVVAPLCNLKVVAL